MMLVAPAWYSSELSLGARTGAGSFIVALAATTVISGMLGACAHAASRSSGGQPDQQTQRSTAPCDRARCYGGGRGERPRTRQGSGVGRVECDSGTPAGIRGGGLGRTCGHGWLQLVAREGVVAVVAIDEVLAPARTPCSQRQSFWQVRQQACRPSSASYLLVPVRRRCCDVPD